MSTNQVLCKGACEDAIVARVDMKLEAVVIPVADVDRAKEFYARLGWRLDADFRGGNGFRVVQFTPPGSGCSVQFGTNITSAAPGSAQGIYLIVSGIEAAREELVARGVECQRGIPRWGTRRSVSARRHKRPRGWAGARSRQLRLLRHVQGPRRQRLAAAGGHYPVARAPRPRRDSVRLGERSGERAETCGGRPWPAREAERPARRKLARLVRRVYRGGAGWKGSAAIAE